MTIARAQATLEPMEFSSWWPMALVAGAVVVVVVWRLRPPVLPWVIGGVLTALVIVAVVWTAVP
jgi:hypothetical protein